MDQSLAIQEGLAISLTGILVVFMALTSLALFFHFVMPFMMTLPDRLKEAKTQKEKETLMKRINTEPLPGEENAAIAAAIQMYMNELHDDESTTLTINKQPKAYSPWSSKIYSTHQVR
ncbi:OadG family protein [Aureibacter tunicatorum]|uniref:Na+-transporting methylmalonyl-CoA/oxaloacetate decarboxylase gamma subunit n=1 Tax=Aureibacter tunicatorum TaxID=866807 RepID=A0AAE3XND2_9BACT|nr:OadG family protein [Aureibacter tunicatorum]MDR6238921.1 Na+-transporting methylmalonyl-CoA/oxaloacetate decarboxylase gamma subunit [Aureibacter tunicatorum]BDD05152.1 hypothetical protein AUTU_26350 [Aureibacter tunicatorum]